MGYPLLEIAALTAVPLGTVKTRMFHARGKLRRELPTLVPAHCCISVLLTRRRSGDHRRRAAVLPAIVLAGRPD
jgi:hypothetical protein